MRTEKDLLGNILIQDNALWGVHTQRALENFPNSNRKLSHELISAYAIVKRAATEVNGDLGAIEKNVSEAIIQATMEIEQGKWSEHFPIDPLSGGAGTSINMNLNEVIANRANEILGGKRGEYQFVHPLDTVNLHQSTNDTFPSATRVASLFLLEKLERQITALQASLQEKEQKFADIVIVGRTQLMDAVPMTCGQLFSSWSEPISRDRWRIFKSVERLKVVNLGGTAIGTGLGAGRQYIFKVIEKLRAITGLPLTRADNPLEATSNQDQLVEVSGILSALATNLSKIGGDLRFLSSSVVGELELPAVQAGSSIMPGKVNPVVPEYIVQMGMKSLSSFGLLANAVSAGNLQLSQYLPLVSYTIINMLIDLVNACEVLDQKCIQGISVNSQRAKSNLENSYSFAAILVPEIGYEAVEKAVIEHKNGKNLLEALRKHGASDEMIKKAISPSNLRKLGG